MELFIHENFEQSRPLRAQYEQLVLCGEPSSIQQLVGVTDAQLQAYMQNTRQMYGLLSEVMNVQINVFNTKTNNIDRYKPSSYNQNTPFIDTDTNVSVAQFIQKHFVDAKDTIDTYILSQLIAKTIQIYEVWVDQAADNQQYVWKVQQYVYQPPPTTVVTLLRLPIPSPLYVALLPPDVACTPSSITKPPLYPFAPSVEQQLPLPPMKPFTQQMINQVTRMKSCGTTASREDSIYYAVQKILNRQASIRQFKDDVQQVLSQFDADYLDNIYKDLVSLAVLSQKYQFQANAIVKKDNQTWVRHFAKPLPEAPEYPEYWFDVTSNDDNSYVYSQVCYQNDYVHPLNAVESREWLRNVYPKLTQCTIRAEGDCLLLSIRSCLGLPNVPLHQLRIEAANALRYFVQLDPTAFVDNIVNNLDFVCDTVFQTYEVFDEPQSFLFLASLLTHYRSKAIVHGHIIDAGNRTSRILEVLPFNIEEYASIDIRTIYLQYEQTVFQTYHLIHFDPLLLTADGKCPTIDGKKLSKPVNAQDLTRRCNTSRQHMIATLSKIHHIGHQLSDALLYLSDAQLCSLFAEYQANPRTNSLSPKEVQALHRDISFLVNMNYIQYASSLLPRCPSTTQTFKKILSLIAANTSDVSLSDASILSGYHLQAQIQCYIRDVLALTTNHAYQNTLASQSLGLPAVLSAIHEYLQFARLSAGRYGNTYRVAVRHVTTKDVKDVAVMKVSKHSQTDVKGTILHELAIGYAINRMYERYRNDSNKAYLCNVFTFTYGGFFCDYHEATDQVCLDTYTAQFNNTTTLSFQQYIKSVGSVLKYFKLYKEKNVQIRAKSASDLKVSIHQLLLQVALALQMAQDELKFMHYDLHQDNVLIRLAAKNQTRKLTYDRVTIDVSSKQTDLLVPSIIDYGFAVVTTQIVSEGHEEQVVVVNGWPCDHLARLHPQKKISSLGNNSDHYFSPLFDFFKFICTVLFVPLQSDYHTDVQDACRQLIRIWFPYILTRFYNHQSRIDNSTGQTVWVAFNPLLTNFLRTPLQLTDASNAGVVDLSDSNITTMKDIFIGANKEFDLLSFKAGEILSTEGFFRTQIGDTLLDWIQSAQTNS